MTPSIVVWPSQGLEESALGLWGEAVDLVDHQQVCEDRASPEDKLLFGLVVDPDADDIRRLDIHGPLDPLEVVIYQACDDLTDGGLGCSWDTFDEEVTAGDHAYEDQLDEGLVTDHDLLGGRLDLFVSVCNRFNALCQVLTHSLFLPNR